MTPNTHTWSGLARSKGLHTWSCSVEYHCCQKCKKIFESRHDYRYCLGNWIKDLLCPHCGYVMQTKLSAQAFARKQQVNDE